MQRFAKRYVWLFAVTAALAWSTGAYADNLSWTVAGAGVSGSGSMTAINEGGGTYLVTGMTGNITIGGSTDAIDGFTAFSGTWTPGATSTVVTAGGYTDTYDDVVYLTTIPEVDPYGLEFSLAGFTNPLNLCSGTAPNCGAAGLNTYLDNAPVGIGDQVVFSAVATSEPSAAGLLALGLLGLFVFGRRHQRWC